MGRYPIIISKVGELLNDKETSIRQQSISTLVTLYEIFGDRIMSDLEVLPTVRLSHLKSINDAILGKENATTPAINGDKTEKITNIPERRIPKASDTQTKKSKHQSTHSFDSTILSSLESGFASLQDDETENKRKRAVSAPRASITTDSSTEKGETLFNSSGTLSHNENYISPYTVDYIMEYLVEEKKNLSSFKQKFKNEKDLTLQMNKVRDDIYKDDWKCRINALETLRAFAWLGACSYSSFMQSIKKLQEVLGQQILDLRSILVKEACKTISTLAYYANTQFHTFTDLWWSNLMKQVIIKIQVISSSADKCARVLIYSSTGSDGKLLNTICEYCTRKNSTLRKFSYEYLALAIVLWKVELIDKNKGLITKTIVAGLSDADACVRKTSRYLFWLVQDKSNVLLKHIESIFIEVSVRKYLDNSDQLSQSPDMVALSQLMAIPQHTRLNFLDTESSGVQTVSITESSKVHLHVSEINHDNSCSSSNSTKSDGVISSTIEAKKSTTSLRSLSSSSGAVRVNKFKNVKEHDMNLVETDYIVNDSQPPSPPLITTSIHSNATNLRAAKFESVLSNGAQRILKSSSVDSSVTVPSLPPSPPPIEDEHYSISESKSNEINFTKVPSLELFAAEQNISINKNFEDKSSNDGVFIFSEDTLRAMATDNHWETRVRAFTAIRKRLFTASEDNEVLEVKMVETFIDLSLNHITDSHNAVANETIEILKYCILYLGKQSVTRLGSILLVFFQRLGDRRADVREKINNLLNLIRSKFDPMDIIQHLAPKMLEVPDRMKTALMQFLGAIVPHCSNYFTNQSATKIFLGRIATIFACDESSSNHRKKPSVTLTVSGKRLMHLVYKSNPILICRQLSLLPFQQQLVLKKMIETSVPDIEQQINIASKEAGKLKKEFNTNDTMKKGKEESSKTLSPVERHKNVQNNIPNAKVENAIKTSSEITFSSHESLTQQNVGNDDSNILEKSSLSSNKVIDPKYTMTLPKSPEQEYNRSCTKEIGKENGNKNSMTGESIIRYIDLKPVSPSTNTIHKPMEVQSDVSTINKPFGSVSPYNDTLRILSALSLNSSMTVKVEMLQEMKVLIKSGEDSFWEANCSQIVSVLLDVFTAPILNTQDPATCNGSQLTGFSPHEKYMHTTSEIDSPQLIDSIETIHMYSKVLLLLSKYRASCMKITLDLLVMKIIPVSSHVPLAVVTLFEEIFGNITKYDAYKLFHLVLP